MDLLYDAMGDGREAVRIDLIFWIGIDGAGFVSGPIEPVMDGAPLIAGGAAMLMRGAAAWRFP